MRKGSWLGCVLGVSLALGCGGSGSKGSPDASEPPPEDEVDAGGEDASSEDAGESDAGESDASESDAGDDGGAPATANKGKLRGRVTYADGTAVGQVNLRIGGKLYKSDSRGVFSADDVDEGEREVTVEDGRVSRAQLKLKVERDTLKQAELSVLPLKKGMIREASEATEVSDGSFKVRLKAGALLGKGANGAVSGGAEARYALLKEARDVSAAPGQLKGMAGDREVQLESFGMAELRFFQGEDELALSAEAEVELPLAPNTFTNAQEVDAWSFDTAQGVWKQAGKATVDKSGGGNGVAKLKASRAAWWSIASQVPDSTCLSGTLQTADGQALSAVWVQAVGANYWGTFGTFSDDKGKFCLSVKPGASTTLSAFGVSGQSYFEWKQTVQADSGAAQCGGSCKELGVISGTSLFDECTGDVTHDQNRTLLLSSGEPTLDATLKSGLEALGHSVTLGVSYDLFDGKIDLSPYDAVYLQANYNWSGRDMPTAGQRQLINWVNCGGGLVTTEWTTWKIGSGQFALIDAIFPAARTTAYSSPSMETYTKVTPDATLNAGLPDSFSFGLTSYGGTESNLNPRLGAVIYYDAMTLDSGLLGWSYNLGRVASFSTTVGTAQVSDATFVRLIGNTLNWVQRD